jgi:ElaB/YqjD/DUF883 family membrane-anchored ribosome-binding protein
MEVYFKNLTSEEISLEKLVEDLSMLANDVELLMQVSGAGLAEESRERLTSAVARIKARCESLKAHAMAGARATDRAIRSHPYPSLGIAFGVGVLLAVLALRKSR